MGTATMTAVHRPAQQSPTMHAAYRSHKSAAISRTTGGCRYGGVQGCCCVRSLAPTCANIDPIVTHSINRAIPAARSEAQNGYAARRTTGPITNRAVSRSGGVLRSVGGYYSRSHATRRLQCERGQAARRDFRTAQGCGRIGRGRCNQPIISCATCRYRAIMSPIRFRHACTTT